MSCLAITRPALDDAMKMQEREIQMPPISPERRRWLGENWLWLRTIGGLLLFLPVLKFLNFRVPKRPRLLKVNRYLKPGGFIIEPEFIIFDLDSGLLALSRTCTHLGCRLNFNEQVKLLVCPCHQSRFSQRGKRVAGPARRDLPVYPVQVVGNPADRNAFIVTVT
jgi:nitrite reductase/ring-hydroxylating ferredoxin subunit